MAALAMVATLPGRTQGLGLITEPLIADLHVDRVTYATINLWATLIGAAFCLPCGRLLDRYGSRIVLTLTVLFLGATVVGMRWMQGFAALSIAITLTRGFGQSALSVVSLALVGKWFARQAQSGDGSLRAAGRHRIHRGVSQRGRGGFEIWLEGAVGHDRMGAAAGGRAALLADRSESAGGSRARTRWRFRAGRKIDRSDHRRGSAQPGVLDFRAVELAVRARLFRHLAVQRIDSGGARIQRVGLSRRAGDQHDAGAAGEFRRRVARDEDADSEALRDREWRRWRWRW